ncbi:MAG: glycosyltransferase family 9 protein [Segetibacter sp.]|nr:glycosyltransferase family 9 protein [Segetibacter sp.]
MSSPYPVINNVKKIAVLRANALGDFIVTLPAFKAIQNTYPNAEIILLGKPWHKAFLVEGRSPVDRVIVVPVKKGIRNEVNQMEKAAETEQFFEDMEQEQFDIAISFQGNGNSANPFVKRLAARYTAGLWTEGAERLDRCLNYYYYQSETLRYLEVASLIGATPLNFEPEINVLEEDKKEIRHFLSEVGNKPFIALHPVATDIRRMWPVENYAGLADILQQKGFQIVFTGSADDRKVADGIIADMKQPAFNVCGNLTLGGLAALLAEAALMVSADTGPLHLARAVNTPTVGIYWAPNLINWGPVTRNIHRPVVSWNMPCPFCGVIPYNPYPFEPVTTDCKHEVSFVRDVTVVAVMEAVESLLPALKGEYEMGWLAGKQGS